MLKEIITAVIASVATIFILWIFDIIGKFSVSVNVPPGAVVAFNLPSCPDDTWKDVANAKGRYIVGLTKNGVLGATVGKPLKDQLNIASGKHIHTISDSGLHGHAIKRTDSKAGTGRYIDLNALGVENTKSKTSGGIEPAGIHSHSIEENTGSDGTNSPYIQFLFCEKK